MLPLNNDPVIFRRMASLLGSGVLPSEAIEIPRADQALGVRKRLERAAEHVRQGSTVEQVFRREGLLSPLHGALLSAGESTGRLDAAFTWLAEVAERERAVRNRINQELLAPKLTLAVAIPFALALAASEPHAAALLLLALSLIFVWVLLVGFLLSGANGLPEARMEVSIHWTPGVRKVAAELALARFAHTFGVLHGAGIEAVHALRAASAASGSTSLARQIATAIPGIEKGQGIAAALSLTDTLPPDLLGALSTGEAGGSIESMMVYAARTLEDDTLVKAHQLAVVLGVAALLIDAGVVFLIASGLAR